MHLEHTTSRTTAVAIPSAAPETTEAAMRERSDLLVQVETLNVALVTSRCIGAAIGLLMAREAVTYDGALALLRERSSHTNVKLHEVASELVREANSLADRTQSGASIPEPRAHARSNGLPDHPHDVMIGMFAANA